MFAALEKSPNFSELTKKFSDVPGFLSGISELEIAYRLHKRGFAIGFYPKTSARYICDFQAQKKESLAYFEISNIVWSEEKRKAVRTFDVLSQSPLTFFEVETAGKIHKPLSQPRIWELKRKSIVA